MKHHDKLKMEALYVESFETSRSDDAAGGTVRAHATATLSLELGPMPACRTCSSTCETA